MKVIYIIICVLSVVVSSCENKEKDAVVPEFPSDTLVVANDYPEINSELVLKVMEDLEFCTSNDTINSLPPCSNKYFRIFKVGPKVNLDDAFLLEMRAGLFNTPVKQLILIQKDLLAY